MKEMDIIKRLYSQFLRHRQCIAAVHHNMNMLDYCGESDFIAVTRAGMIHEVEVKVSRSDFKADLKKVNRHLHLSGKGVTITSPYRGEQHERLAERRPNYFWYAAPYGLIKVEELPPYAGLIEVGDFMPQRKSAPRIHSKNLWDDRMKQAMLTSLSYKWV